MFDRFVRLDSTTGQLITDPQSLPTKTTSTSAERTNMRRTGQLKILFGFDRDEGDQLDLVANSSRFQSLSPLPEHLTSLNAHLTSQLANNNNPNDLRQYEKEKLLMETQYLKLKMELLKEKLENAKYQTDLSRELLKQSKLAKPLSTNFHSFLDDERQSSEPIVKRKRKESTNESFQIQKSPAIVSPPSEPTSPRPSLPSSSSALPPKSPKQPDLLSKTTLSSTSPKETPKTDIPTATFGLFNLPKPSNLTSFKPKQLTANEQKALDEQEKRDRENPENVAKKLLKLTESKKKKEETESSMFAAKKLDDAPSTKFGVTPQVSSPLGKISEVNTDDLSEDDGSLDLSEDESEEESQLKTSTPFGTTTKSTFGTTSTISTSPFAAPSFPKSTADSFGNGGLKRSLVDFDSDTIPTKERRTEESSSFSTPFSEKGKTKEDKPADTQPAKNPFSLTGAGFTGFSPFASATIASTPAKESSFTTPFGSAVKPIQNEQKEKADVEEKKTTPTWGFAGTKPKSDNTDASAPISKDFKFGSAFSSKKEAESEEKKEDKTEQTVPSKNLFPAATSAFGTTSLFTQPKIAATPAKDPPAITTPPITSTVFGSTPKVEKDEDKPKEAAEEKKPSISWGVGNQTTPSFGTETSKKAEDTKPAPFTPATTFGFAFASATKPEEKKDTTSPFGQAALPTAGTTFGASATTPFGGFGATATTQPPAPAAPASAPAPTSAPALAPAPSTPSTFGGSFGGSFGSPPAANQSPSSSAPLISSPLTNPFSKAATPPASGFGQAGTAGFGQSGTVQSSFGSALPTTNSASSFGAPAAQPNSFGSNVNTSFGSGISSFGSGLAGIKPFGSDAPSSFGSGGSQPFTQITNPFSGSATFSSFQTGDSANKPAFGSSGQAGSQTGTTSTFTVHNPFSGAAATTSTQNPYQYKFGA